MGQMPVGDQNLLSLQGTITPRKIITEADRMPPVFQVHLQVVALVTEEEAEIFQKPIATCAI